MHFHRPIVPRHHGENPKAHPVHRIQGVQDTPT